jgi:DnaD/phage-associated family protein
LTEVIADGLKADIDDYSEEWVLSAIEYATKQEKRSLGYMEGCLRGWKRDGLIKPPDPKQPKQPKTKGDNTEFFANLEKAAKENNAWLPEKKLLKSSAI